MTGLLMLVGFGWFAGRGHAQPGVARPAGRPSLDRSIVRVGVCRDRDIETCRLLAFRGDWTMVLQQGVNASASSMSAETLVTIPEGEFVALLGSKRGFVVRTSSGEEHYAGYDLAIVRGGVLLSIEQLNQQTTVYRGELHIHREGANLCMTNLVPLADCLKSHVAAVMPSSEPEAIKAQIVISRTALLEVRRRNATAPVDFDDTDPTYRYPGAASERELVSLLVDEMPNQILTAGGATFEARWHHTCGGITSTASEILGLAGDRHVGQVDRVTAKGNVNCFHSPMFNWQVELNREEMQDFLDVCFAGGAHGVIRGWRVVSRDAVGRITAVDIDGVQRVLRLRGEEFMAKLHEHFGARAFKSAWFEENPMQRSILYRGRGCGHGVGMCQMGADGMARQGMNYLQILGFYFPWARLEGGSGSLIIPTAGSGRSRDVLSGTGSGSGSASGRPRRRGARVGR